jgi:hypothetical protein
MALDFEENVSIRARAAIQLARTGDHDEVSGFAA